MQRQPGGAESGAIALRVLAALIFLADAIVAVVLGVEVAEGGASRDTKHWFGHTAALAGIILISVAIAILRRVAIRAAQPPGEAAQPVPGVLIGSDNRLSTSKLSAFAWTWVIAWTLLSLVIADWAGAPGGWHSFVKAGIQDEYLVLLGGPFVALVSAKALVSNAVANGSQTKTPAEENETSPAHRVAQAFSDDTGQTDLVDTQYLLFGSITLLVFVVDYLRKPSGGLPTLPEALIGLSSLGATAYIANKWTAKDAKPRLETVVPNAAKRGATITLYGSNLLTVSQGGKRVPASEQLELIFGSLAQQAIAPNSPNARSSPSGSDYVRLTVPYVADAKLEPEGKAEVDLLLRNAIGVSSENTLPFTIER